MNETDMIKGAYDQLGDALLPPVDVAERVAGGSPYDEVGDAPPRPGQ